MLFLLAYSDDSGLWFCINPVTRDGLHRMAGITVADALEIAILDSELTQNPKTKPY